VDIRRARLTLTGGITERLRCQFQLQGDGASTGSASLLGA
jgi:hypothetical protein